LLFAVFALGCGPKQGAGLEKIPPRTAVVGEELQIPLHADGSAVTFDFESDIEDLKTRRLHAILTPYAGGTAIFRWIPLGRDVGEHQLRFVVESDGLQSSLLVQVTVLAGPDAITFREPIGDGTTLDLARADCADVSILVEDASALSVTLSPGELWAENAELLQIGALDGRLRFCPSPEQADAATIFPLSLRAENEFGGRAEKRYTIVLGALSVPPAPSPGPCDEVGPTLSHQKQKDVTTRNNLTVYLDADDPDGVRGASLFWSTATSDRAQMSELGMLYVGGNRYAATLPNPIRDDAPGAEATVHYFLRAVDRADGLPGCAPNASETPSHSFVVTAP
jgi:hypothetical protein